MAHLRHATVLYIGAAHYPMVDHVYVAFADALGSHLKLRHIVNGIGQMVSESRLKRASMFFDLHDSSGDGKLDVSEVCVRVCCRGRNVSLRVVECAPGAHLTVLADDGASSSTCC